MLRRKHIKYLLLFSLSLCIFLSVLISFSPKIQAASIQTYHPSIIIIGNDALDDFCAGNGTSGNITHPHVIKDIEITYDGVQYGIEIKNVDKYLVMDNVNVSEYFQSTLSTGIYLENVSHLTIDRSHFYNNSYGIVMKNVNDSRIEDTSGSINKVRGITMENCYNNTMYNVVAFENGLEENAGNGMDMISSNNNTIQYCLFIENWGHGLYMQNSLYNVVFDTEFLLNHGECYVIEGDPEGTNNFYNNNCRNRLIPGASVGIIAVVSLCTVTILVVTVKKFKKRS
jgi:parallel beta-helix repeat protein